MKKKLISMLLASTMLLSLVGCGEEKNKETESTIETESVEESTVEVITQESETEAETQETVEEIVPVITQGVDSIEYDGTLYLLDENGYISSTVKKEDLAKLSFLTDSEKKMVKNSYLKGIYHGKILLVNYSYDSEDGKTKIYLIDQENEKLTMLFDTEDYQYRSSEELDDKLYLVCEDMNMNHFCESIFVETENGFETEENPVQSIIDRYAQIADSVLYKYNSFTSVLNTCGFLILKSGDEYVCVDANGQETPVDLGDDGYVVFYTKDYIYYLGRNPETEELDYYFYNINSGISTQSPDDFSFYCMNNKLYRLVDESEEYGIVEYHLYEYSPEAGALEEVFSAKDVPGVSGVVSGSFGLTFKNDVIYYLQEEKKGACWYLSKYTDAGYSPESLQVYVEDFDLFDYGTVSYRTTIESCPKCDFDYGMLYVEEFQCTLDAPGVSKINETLSKISNDQYDGGFEDISVCGVDDHEYHDEAYPCYYSYDFTIDEVGMLGSHYLQVTYGGYCYTGGAHGFPLLTQCVFDLNTGEQITIDELYAGSGEEFAQLVAENVKDHYDVCMEEDGYTPYFAESADAAYEDALATDISSATIIFAEDTAYVVYPPYEMGSFASGFIYVPISYEEFGFDFE